MKELEKLSRVFVCRAAWDLFHSMSSKKRMSDLKIVQIRLELINSWGLCLVWVLVDPEELVRSSHHLLQHLLHHLRGSPRLQRSRPETPPPPPGTPTQAMQPPPPPPPKLPAKFSQEPPSGVVMSSGAAASSAAKPEPMRSKTPPKNLPAPRLTEAALNQLKGSVGKVIQPKPRTPSPKRAVEGMARNDLLQVV